MAREFLMLLRETSYGTPDLTTGAPTAGSFAYVRLDDDNAFTPREMPTLVAIPYGGGLDVDALDVADYNEVKGQLQLKLCYSQASLLFGWLVSRINSGRTTPWTTTDASSVMPPGDLASLSIYHAKMRSDGTYERKRYAGCKASNWSLTVNRQGQVASLSIGIVGQKAEGNEADSSSDPDATEFPAPSDSDFATDLALFSHTSGGLKIASVRTLYESITLQSTHKLGAGAMEAKHLSYLLFTGRETTLAAKGLYKASPNDRTALESRTAQDVQLVLTDGSHTITLDLNTNGRVNQLADDLSKGNAYMQEATVKSFWDTSVGGDQGDLSFTYA